MKKFYISLALIAVVVFSASEVLAAQFLMPDENSGNVTVGGNESFRNLYVGGGNVVVNNNVAGDLFVGGGNVSVAGEVEKDLAAAGGNVNISGRVGEDARVAGGDVNLSAPVGGDLLAAGGTVALTANADVGGDFWAAGGAVNLNGDVSGSVRIAGGEVYINSKIGGDVNIQADEKLIFGPLAVVTGKVVYHGRNEAVLEQGAQVSSIQFEKIEGGKKSELARIFSWGFIIKLLSILLVALLAWKFLPRTVAIVTTTAYQNPWLSLGLGVVGLILIPIVMVVLFVTFIGVYAAMLLGIWFAFALTITCAMMVTFIGAVIDKWINKKAELEVTWQSVVWGVVAFGILTVIPFVGWLAIFVLYLMTFGSILQMVRERLRTIA